MSAADDVQDALVDTYRALQAINRAARAAREALAPAVPALVLGTGRSCKPGRFVPSKRIKALHRAHRIQRVDGAVVAMSLKAYARLQLRQERDSDRLRAAGLWLASKGVRP